MITSHRSRIISLAALLLALSACQTTHVVTDSNAAANLSACKSFDWLEPDVAAQRSVNPAFDNPINDQRLRTAVSQRLGARGVQPVAPGGKPDCLVGHAIGARHSRNGRSGPRWSFGVGTGWGGYRSGTTGSVMFDTADYDLREGRVSIDVYRAGNREPLWHAEADVDVTELRGADAEKRISDVVTAIFAKYPQ
jgi:hypothetical protein